MTKCTITKIYKHFRRGDKLWYTGNLTVLCERKYLCSSSCYVTKMRGCSSIFIFFYFNKLTHFDLYSIRLINWFLCNSHYQFLFCNLKCGSCSLREYKKKKSFGIGRPVCMRFLYRLQWNEKWRGQNRSQK